MTTSPQDDYVTLREARCHHRGITRLQSEEILLAEREDGSFLIRDSETFLGAYTLCLLHQGRVHQYRVLPDQTGKIYVQAERGVQERKFSDLGQLVADYLQRGARNGLVCALRHPVEIQETVDDETDDDDDELPAPRPSLPGLPPPPGACPPRGPPSATSSGSSAGSTTSLDKPRRPSPGDRTSVVDTPDPWADKDQDYVEDFNVENNPVRRYVTSRFSQLDMSNVDGSFPASLRDYIERGVFKDASAVTAGDDRLAQLRTLLAMETRLLDRHLESFLVKIDLCRQLFGPITTNALSGNKADDNQAPDLDAFMDRLTLCKSALLKLEKKATHRLSSLATEEPTCTSLETSEPPPTLPKRGPKETPQIPSSSYEAKLAKPGKLTAPHKVTLKVDIHQGKLFMVRPSKEVLDASNVFSHDKVLQLIKSTTNNTRLDMRLEGHKTKDTIFFEDLRQRESFCQLLQQMKFLHSSHQEVDRLSVFIGTWNMGDEPAKSQIHEWLRCQGTGKSRAHELVTFAFDLYVIGTQESGSTEKEFVQKIQKSLSECVQTDLVLLTSSTLWGIRLVILVKPAYKNKITHIQQSTVKTGIANALGNKGASAVSFSFNGTSFCFINCHLTSGFEKNGRRNQNFRDIIKGLNLGPKSLSLFDVTNQFHHLFFLGDLNYRIHGMDSVEIIKKIGNKEFEELKAYDQLRNSQKNGECFVDFAEEEITFPPTYRIAKGTKDKYEWQKFKKTGVRINAPSWCDRVLWRSYPETYIINTSYGCVESISTSDHKPVFASFDIGIINQFAGSNTVQGQGTTGDVSIILEDVHAEVKTSTTEQFKLEFYSSCLEGPVSSTHSWQNDPPKPGYNCPHWEATQIPNLYPIVDDRDYLEDQHVLITVKSADGMESYGECVVALKSMFAICGQRFDCRLTHMGEVTGALRGQIHVKCQKDRGAGRGRRSYELIYMDTDKLFQERDTLLRGGALSGPGGPSSSLGPCVPGGELYTMVEEKGPAKKPLGKTMSLTGVGGGIERSSSPAARPAPPPTARPTPGARDQYESIWLKGADAESATSPPGEEPKPRHTPRMGQSSLAAAGASPELRATTSPTELRSLPASGLVSPGDSVGGEYECVSMPPPEPGRKPAKPSVPRKLSNTTQGSFMIQDNPFYERQYDPKADPRSSTGHKVTAVQKVTTGGQKVTTGGQKVAVGQKVLTSPKGATGPEAAKKPPSKPAQRPVSSVLVPGAGVEPLSDYATLRPPTTVAQWLRDLGLPQYTAQFQAQGWDHLDFVTTDLSHADLVHMDVTNAEHRATIMESLSVVRRPLPPTPRHSEV